MNKDRPSKHPCMARAFRPGVLSMHDSLDGPDQECAPLSDLVIAEKLRQAYEERRPLYLAAGLDAPEDLLQ